MPADLILKNGKIATVDPQDRIVDAVAIKGDRFVAAGTEAEVMSHADRSTSVVDLGGRTAIPGIVDSHIHLTSTGLLLEGVMLFDARNMDDVRERVAARVSQLKPGQWVEGGGWIDSQFAEYRPPTRWDLDSASPNNPVILGRLFGGVVVNSKALELAGIDRSTPDPERGTIERDPKTGEPTGYLRNGAQVLVSRLMSDRPAEQPVRRARRLTGLAMNELIRWGITSVVDPGVPAVLMQAYQQSRDEGRLPLRVNMMPTWHGLSAVRGEAGEQDYKPAALGARTGLGDEWLRIGALKMAIDGGLGSKTAWCSEPWIDGTRSEIPLRLDTDKLGHYFDIADRHDWSVGIHCCGDVAQDVACREFKQVLDAQGGSRPHRHNIIHGYLPSPEALDIMAEYGIGTSVQPGFIWVEGDIYFDVVEQERLEYFKPLRTYIKHGIKVAANSDMASAHYNPFLGMFSAVARRTSQGRSMGDAERVNRIEMLRLFTHNGTWLTGEEDLKGSIEPGKLADLAVLSGDILTIPDDAIRDLTVEMTLIGGKVVHRA